MDLIPADESARLVKTIADAQKLAERNQVSEGYELLDLMLSWAESPALDPVTWECALPEPWSAALIDGYRLALVTYCCRYHVTFPVPNFIPLTVQERIATALATSRRLRATSMALQNRSRALRSKDAARRLVLGRSLPLQG